MNNRYVKVFEGEKDLYLKDSPVIIKAHVLLKDNKTGNSIIQIKFQNADEKKIKYVRVRITLFDSLNVEVGNKVEFAYEDLNTEKYAQFGEKTPIVINSGFITSFKLNVIGVAFSDGSTWLNDKETWRTNKEFAQNIDFQVTYNGAVSAMNAANTESTYKAAAATFKSISEFQDADALAEQCLDKAEVCRKDAIYASARTEQMKNSIAGCESAIKLFESIFGWKDADEQIYACRKKIEEIKAKEEADRLECERQAEQKRIAAKKAAKKFKKIAAIVTPVAAVCIAFAILLPTVIIPTVKYNSAVGLYNAGKYDEAIKAFTALNGYKGITDKAAECLFLMQKSGLTNITVGSTIKFGFYEQDNNTSNGKEEIEWKVLAVEGNKALIISKYALDCQKYNSIDIDTTWEKCALRTWLNETFYNNAFGAYHQKMIASSTVTADKNPLHSTSPGNNTTDKVFLLSITEVNKYLGSNEARKCALTDYVIAQGAWPYGGNAWWWLRSPGSHSAEAAIVLDDGSVYNNGVTVIYEDNAVRPVMWINLDF